MPGPHFSAFVTVISLLFVKHSKQASASETLYMLPAFLK